jgi:4-hydroxy-2-oxoheptanedioate aldolase
MSSAGGSGTTGFRARLGQGEEALLGIFITIPRIEMVEIAGAAGFDFVLLDCEHGPQTIESLPALVAAANAAGVAAIVRPPDTRTQGIGAALDVGADAVMVPRVSGLEEARGVVAATRFPPSGTRGLHPAVRAAAYGLEEDFMNKEDARRGAIVMIEDLGAVAEIEEIASLPELDGLFIGPSDLSVDAGAPGQLDHPIVAAAIEKVLAAARENGVATGAFAGTPEAAAMWKRRGARLIALSSDLLTLSQGLRQDLKATRALFAADD